MKKYYFLSILLLVISLAGCMNENHSKAGTFYGPPKTMGNGTIRTFVTLSNDGSPVSIGFIFSEDMLSGLPTGKHKRYKLILNFPAQAASAGYNHAELDWNPHGHEPKGVYDFPHFDFHFYFVGMNKLHKIIPGPDTVNMAPQYIPKDYKSGIIAIPNMGVHWVDTTSAEFHGQKFTSTFIYGFYHGEMYFVEPMITKAFLKTKSDISMPVKQPEVFQKTGYYPTRWSIQYLEDKHQYKVSLDGLVKRIGQ